MKYFKAELNYISELYINNDINQGCDPYTFQYSGICSTITNNTKEGLLKDLIDQFGEIEHFENNRYETGYDELERDGTHVCVSISIYVYEVNETETNFELECE